MEFLKEFIINFENQKVKDKKTGRYFGVVYTPNDIANFIVKSIFKIYIIDLLKPLGSFTEERDIHNLVQILVKNSKLKESFDKKMKDIKILDPSCGSGRFLIAFAEFLFNLRKRITPDLNEFDLKKQIIQNNIYGIDIDKSTCVISKLRLLNWLYSDHKITQDFSQSDVKKLKDNNFEQIFQHFDVNLNVSNLDYLLEFDAGKSFDFIIGNPPYIENKKLKNNDYKKQLYKKFYSAYRLFDLSVVFLEKSLQILKDNSGYLSFILPNKFLSSDYGIKIRELLIKKTELKEIINVSSLPIFQKNATYPIILSLTKRIPTGSNEIIIKTYSTIEDIIKGNGSKFYDLPQNLTNQLPSNVIPISGNIELISHIYSNFKTISETFTDLKIIYRPYGFLKYSKHFDNISEKRMSEKDLLLIGTGNVGKYHIKYKKRIKIAKKDIEVSYFNYKPDFQNIWENLSGEKIIFREIAKDLTCVYDPGHFTNITGLYFMKIPSLNTEKLYSLLTILNSKLIDSVFKTLFGTLHMSGGFLRFNGSFIKRLPMPKQFPISLSYLGKILQFLFQLKYEMITNPNTEFLKNINLGQIEDYISFFSSFSDSLVNNLYLNNNYPLLNKALNSKNSFPNVQFKNILVNFKKSEFESYKEFKSDLIDIRNCFLKLSIQNELVDEIKENLKNFFSL